MQTHGVCSQHLHYVECVNGKPIQTDTLRVAVYLNHHIEAVSEEQYPL